MRGVTTPCLLSRERTVMEHLLAVGTVTDAARALIERANGRIWHVSDTPSVTLVQLPDPQFCGVTLDGRIARSLLRVRLSGGSLIWQGESDYHEPEMTSVDKTMLKAEDEYEQVRSAPHGSNSHAHLCECEGCHPQPSDGA